MEQLTLEQAASNHTKDYFKEKDTAYSSFKAGAEWQKEQPSWISVNDELPPYLEYILVYNTEGATLVARLFENGWVALFSDGEKFMEELAPTHWQHLPKPPVK